MSALAYRGERQPMDENNAPLSPKAQAVMRTLSRLGPAYGFKITGQTASIADELLEHGFAVRAADYVRLTDAGHR